MSDERQSGSGRGGQPLTVPSGSLRAALAGLALLLIGGGVTIVSALLRILGGTSRSHTFLRRRCLMLLPSWSG